MSDLNDLIHTNAVIAFQQGEKTERNRILLVLGSKLRDYQRLAVYNRSIGDLHSLVDNQKAITQLEHYLTLIKGKHK